MATLWYVSGKIGLIYMVRNNYSFVESALSTVSEYKMLRSI
ncbi:MAG: hypothetical protein UZ12_BCD005001291 [Bacteroidetes bacterium OLB12]|nr:MAG: hypothetical protein UZ12_BCD005001291 [Bacteroidetes bacterium OLB12]